MSATRFSTGAAALAAAWVVPAPALAVGAAGGLVVAAVVGAEVWRARRQVEQSAAFDMAWAELEAVAPSPFGPLPSPRRVRGDRDHLIDAGAWGALVGVVCLGAFFVSLCLPSLADAERERIDRVGHGAVVAETRRAAAAIVATPTTAPPPEFPAPAPR